MAEYTSELYRVGDITGNLYMVPGRKTNRIVVYGIGAPMAPDSGSLPDAKYILDFDVDLFVPDYIGYGRTEGRFTPRGCIKTFLDLHEAFLRGVKMTNSYKQSARDVKYDEIHHVGRSFGGAYVPLLPRYNPSIKNLCIIYPILDYKGTGSIEGEETTDGFMRAMFQDGYRHLYRGIGSRAWRRHLRNEDGLMPEKNIEHLEDANLYIAHGMQDRNINYTRSVDFYEKIITRFPSRSNQFRLDIYPEGDHSYKTSNLAVAAYLSWLNVPIA